MGLELGGFSLRATRKRAAKQVRCPLDILGAQRMLYRLIDELVLLVSLTGLLMQRRHLLRLDLARALA
jgi:hypothetical protein